MQRLAFEARGIGESSGAPSSGFADLLRKLDRAASTRRSRARRRRQQLRSSAATADVSLPEVMIALQKASLSFQAMTEVRNRLVSAYQEIMSMPI